MGLNLKTLIAFILFPLLGFGQFTTPQHGNNYNNEAASNGLLNNLVAAWELDETTGTTVYDSHGTINGTAYGGLAINQTGKIGGAYYLAGPSSGDYISLTNNSAFNTNSTTWSAWIKSYVASPPPTDVQGLIYKSSTTSAVRDIGSYFNTNETAAFTVGNGTTNYGVNTTTDYWDTNWHLIVCVKKYGATNDSLLFYIDGTSEVVKTEMVGHGSKSSAALEFGRVSSTSTSIRYFKGYVDMIRIWSRALSAEDAEALWKNGDGLPYSDFTY